MAAATIAPGRADKTKRAIARATEAVAAVPPHVDAVVARAAIVRVTSRTESRNMITNYLAAHSTALVDGGSGAPDPLVRLIEDLIASGFDGVVLPRCFDCREAMVVSRPVPGGRACNRCVSRRRPLETCAQCGTLARRAKRDADGQPICGGCNRLTYVPAVHRCGVCGVNRTYSTKKRICRECAELPHTSCAACGLPAAVPTDGTDPRCSHCAAGTTEPCRECGELTAGRDRKGRARCERCYQRPVGTCGRCGRVRAIVRVAVDGDPDLCAICWTGPTARCENCGKVRPCRGERRGRMLCGTCAPVRAQTCAHCGQQRRPTAQWPEGPVCRGCYDRALNAKGSCPRCGEHRRLMRYDGGETAICHECAGVSAHHVCGRCGDEHAPYQRGLCARCVTTDRLTELLGDKTARRERGLDGLFELLLSVRSLKDRPRWLAKSPVVPLLAELGRGELDISHEALDRHPSRQAARRLEDLLVASGALPSRDTMLARMEEWIEQHLAGSAHEPVLRPFAHWIVLRRYRRKSQHAPLNAGELGRAKAGLASGTAFLNWLTERGRPLEQCAQADIDAWLAGPRADRHIARQFARWAMAQKLMPRLNFPAAHRRSPTPPIAQLTSRLLEDPEIPARDRVAAILVAVYAQPIVRVARFRIDQITITDTETTIQLAATPVELPAPIAAALRAWLHQRQASMPPLATPSPWLFPGNPPSRPIGEPSLSRQLKLVGIECNQDRRAALLHLAAEIPAAVLSDLVGIHVNTAGAWADMAGRPWGDYPSLREPSN
jgi:hypothetical protein